MPTSRRSLPVVLALVLAALATTTARAQTVSPVPAPTIITTAPYTISKPGYYQLGKDLTVAAASGNIITVAASNVTLDFAGHYISGPSDANSVANGKLFGVYANERGNITVQNGTVAYCVVGVFLNGNGNTGSLNINQTVQKMLLTYCSFAGAILNKATNSVLDHNRVSYIGGCRLDNLGVSGLGRQPEAAFADGLDSLSGGGNSITNNTISSFYASSENTGILDYLHTTVVSGNAISNLSQDGTGIEGAALALNNTIVGCSAGIENCNKYSNNFTSGCSTPFSGGTPVGYNN